MWEGSFNRGTTVCVYNTELGRYYMYIRTEEAYDVSKSMDQKFEKCSNYFFLKGGLGVGYCY